MPSLYPNHPSASSPPATSPPAWCPSPTTSGPPSPTSSSPASTTRTPSPSAASSSSASSSSSSGPYHSLPSREVSRDLSHQTMRSFSNIYNLPWKTCSHQSKSISTFSVSGFFDILEYADSAEFADRIDGFQTGILDVIRTTTGNVAHPWVQIYNNLGKCFPQRSTELVFYCREKIF